MRSAFLLGLLFATSSFAQRTRLLVVSVATDEADRAAAQSLMAFLPQTLRTADERLDVTSLEDLTDERAIKRNSNGDRGIKLLRAAELARKTTSDGISEQYQQARELLDEADWRTTSDPWLTSLAWAGALSKSESDLRLLFTLRPDFAFPSINPVTDQFIQEQRQSKSSATRVRFEVRSDVPATVWVDGKPVGPTPATLEVIAGRHRVAAVSAGRTLYQHEELISSGTVVQLPFEDSTNGPNVRAGLADIAAGFRTGESLAPIKRFATEMKAPEVLVVGLVPTDKGLEVRVVRMNLAGVASTSSRTIPKNADVANTAVVLTRALYDRPIGVTLTEGGEVSIGPTRRTASFISLGSAGGVAIAGAVLLAIAGGQFRGAQMIPQTSSVLFDQAVAQARTTQTAGLVTLIVGALGVGLGGYLFFTSQAAPTPTGDDVKQDERL